MTSNVLPFFWHLASSSKDTRLSASADLVSSLEAFQSTYLENKPEVNGDEDEADEEDESDEESGEEVDASDEEDNQVDMEEARRLDKKLGSSNAEDVVYSVKRLVRGLASSRESSRLGFAVALTEVSTASLFRVDDADDSALDEDTNSLRFSSPVTPPSISTSRLIGEGT
jgi:DNA polymerase phi